MWKSRVLMMYVIHNVCFKFPMQNTRVPASARLAPEMRYWEFFYPAFLYIYLILKVFERPQNASRGKNFFKAVYCQTSSVVAAACTF